MWYAGIRAGRDRQFHIPRHPHLRSAAHGRAPHDLCRKLLLCDALRHFPRVQLARIERAAAGGHLLSVEHLVHAVLVRVSFIMSVPTRPITRAFSYIWRNPVYHQVVFGCLLFATTFRTIYLLWNGELAKKLPESQRSTITRLYTSGATTFAVGFVVWNLDNIFCSNITRWKQSIGWPAAFLLEGLFVQYLHARMADQRQSPGHSWWHILTVSRLRCPSPLGLITHSSHRRSGPT